MIRGEPLWQVDEETLNSGACGFTAKEIFCNNPSSIAYTYDDVIVMPGHIGFGIGDVDISSQLTKNIKLKAPFHAPSGPGICGHLAELLHVVTLISLASRVRRLPNRGYYM